MFAVKNISAGLKALMLLVFGWLFVSQGLAQHGNVWALGYKRGIDFNVNPPVLIKTAIVRDTASITITGNPDGTFVSVSYSDCKGQLLVYGSPRQLWNRYNRTM